MSTIEELDRLVLMINEKANDLEFLSGLNRLVDAYTNDRSVEGSGEGQEDCEAAREGNEINAESQSLLNEV